MVSRYIYKIGVILLFGDTPRGLAVTPDGSTVYVAIGAVGPCGRHTLPDGASISEP